jgi:peptide-methionine (S)-S-oxide reductase
MEKATFGGGCFWCTEAVFQRIKGVNSVVSGYAGGQEPSPTYEEVSSGETGYAEAVQLEFDPAVVDYETLLEIFWATHDPTTLNRQGNDVGSQYRSIIFYHSEDQRVKALKFKEEIAKQYSEPIVTKVEEFKNFYTAEQYHQNFYDNNRAHPYCQIVIDPKVAKLLEKFSDKLKEV